jgi:AraC-like DNA-binding protein
MVNQPVTTGEEVSTPSSCAAEQLRWSSFPGGLVLDCTRAGRPWRLVHSHYTLCVVHRGRADWEYRGLHFSCDPGTVYVCEPGEVHVTRRVHVPGDYTVFFLDPEAVARAAEQLELVGAPHFSRSGVNRPDLWQRFASAKALLDPESLEQELSRLVATLLLETQPKAHANHVKDSALEGARDLLRERYLADPNRVVRLSAIAEEVGLSYHRLVHAFSRRFGVAPYEYLSLFRAQHALSVLRRGPSTDCDSLAAVAQLCGYSDSAHLSRSFRRYWGHSPLSVARELNPRWAGPGRAPRTKPRRAPPG